MFPAPPMPNPTYRSWRLDADSEYASSGILFHDRAGVFLLASSAHPPSSTVFFRLDQIHNRQGQHMPANKYRLVELAWLVGLRKMWMVYSRISSVQ
jgi:hypothetical protein